jgi:hypothetical protein
MHDNVNNRVVRKRKHPAFWAEVQGITTPLLLYALDLLATLTTLSRVIGSKAGYGMNAADALNTGSISDIQG